jgi:[ribosomal protein S18]-alanine N-acetyltransferase
VRIVVMTTAYAADIVSWRYPPPYNCYDMTGVDPEFLTSEARSA